MKILKKYKKNRAARLEKKKEELRVKNDQLRKEGKSHTDGSKRLINTGMGGLNNSQSSWDRAGTLLDIQKENRVDKKNKQD